MNFHVGQEVLYVVESGGWHPSYYQEMYWHRTGHKACLGRVVSAGDDTIAVWPEEGRAMEFVPVADVFHDTDTERAGRRIAERNVEAFGNPDGYE